MSITKPISKEQRLKNALFAKGIGGDGASRQENVSPKRQTYQLSVEDATRRTHLGILHQTADLNEQGDDVPPPTTANEIHSSQRELESQQTIHGNTTRFGGSKVDLNQSASQATQPEPQQVQKKSKKRQVNGRAAADKRNAYERAMEHTIELMESFGVDMTEHHPGRRLKDYYDGAGGHHPFDADRSPPSTKQEISLRES